MSSFKGFVHELHRRSIWQVLGIFLAASWGVVEAVDLLTEQVGLPDWTPTMAFVLLLVGLPIVLATAFIQEGMPGQAEGGGSASEAAEPGADAAVEDPPENLSPGTGSLDRRSTRPTTTRRLLTWRNAVMGGLGAFTLLGLSIFVYFIMWTSGVGPVGNLVAQGVFDEGETVVLADFDDDTDAELGDVVTEAIRVDLSESPVISLVPPAYVADGLARMGRPDASTFSAADARELAVRDGIKAVIQGEVAPVGSGYLLTASVVAAESGEVLKAFRVPVDSEDDLLKGIDKLSQDIREQSGESLRSIRAGTGLEEATTASLDALRLYTQAVATFDQGGEAEAIPLLKEALSLDPDFAMAWRKLSVIYSNQGLEPERMREASRKAYELRRRLTEREAGLAEAWYHRIVEDNTDAAIDSYRRLLETYPDDGTALNNLAVNYLELGRWEDAEAPLRRAVEGNPNASGYSNLIQVLWNVGKRGEALAWADTLHARYPESWYAAFIQESIAAGQGDWTEAHAVVEEVVRDAPTGGRDYLAGLAEMAGADLARGRWVEAMDHLSEAKLEAREADASELYLPRPAWQLVEGTLALQGPASARSELAEVMDVFPLSGVGARAGARVTVANLAAVVGDSADARRIFGAYEESFAPEERGRSFRVDRETQRALEAFGAGRWDEAADAFHRLYRELKPCGEMCVLMPEWGVALDEAGRDAEALDVYRMALEDTQLSYHLYRTMWIAPVLERVGRIHEEQGDTTEARGAYQRIVDQFGGGDGPFRAFAERAQRRLAALQ